MRRLLNLILAFSFSSAIMLVGACAQDEGKRSADQAAPQEKPDVKPIDPPGADPVPAEKTKVKAAAANPQNPPAGNAARPANIASMPAFDRVYLKGKKDPLTVHATLPRP